MNLSNISIETTSLQEIESLYKEAKADVLNNKSNLNSISPSRLIKIRENLEIMSDYYSMKIDEPKNILKKCVHYIFGCSRRNLNAKDKCQRRIEKVSSWQSMVESAIYAQKNIFINNTILLASIENIDDIDSIDFGLGAYGIYRTGEEEATIFICVKNPMTKTKRIILDTVEIIDGKFKYQSLNGNIVASTNTSFKRILQAIQTKRYYKPIYTYPYTESTQAIQLVKIAKQQHEIFKTINPGQYKPWLFQLSRKLYKTPNNKTVFAWIDQDNVNRVRLYEINKHGHLIGKGGFNKVKSLKALNFKLEPKDKQLTISRPKAYKKINETVEYDCLKTINESKSLYLSREQLFAYGRSNNEISSAIIKKQYKTNLKDLMRNNQFDEKELLTLFRQVCQSVIELHSLGFIHRDIKESNFLINSNNKVFLSDFGLVDRLSTKAKMLTIRSKGTKGYFPIGLAKKPLKVSAETHKKIDSFALYKVFLQMFNSPRSKELINLKASLQNAFNKVSLDEITSQDLNNQIMLPEELLSTINNILEKY